MWFIHTAHYLVAPPPFSSVIKNHFVLRNIHFGKYLLAQTPMDLPFRWRNRILSLPFFSTLSGFSEILLWAPWLWLAFSSLATCACHTASLPLTIKWLDLVVLGSFDNFVHSLVTHGLLWGYLTFWPGEEVSASGCLFSSLPWIARHQGGRGRA